MRAPRKSKGYWVSFCVTAASTLAEASGLVRLRYRVDSEGLFPSGHDPAAEVHGDYLASQDCPSPGLLAAEGVWAPPCAEAAVGTQGQPGQGMGTLT